MGLHRASLDNTADDWFTILLLPIRGLELSAFRFGQGWLYVIASEPIIMRIVATNNTCNTKYAKRCLRCWQP